VRSRTVAAAAMAVEVLGWQLEELDSSGASVAGELLAMWQERSSALP
jgi:hypothetical protein